MGVTVWRLRPAQTTDKREIRALVQEDGRDMGDWTPERIPADSPLREGQRVRVSVESGEEGYLYLVDRDEYADGTKSDPYVIFPTTRTRGGDNHVKPGVVIQIPDEQDNPNYFKVVRSRADQVNEVITILVSPKPIPGVGNTRNRIRLTEDQMAEWERQSKSTAYRLEAAGQAGKVLTVAEQAASRGGVLTQDDPLPQTMYRVDAKPGDSIMVQLPLKITPKTQRNNLVLPKIPESPRLRGRAIFVVVYLLNVLMPVSLSGDSRWTIPTALSIIHRHTADLRDFTPAIVKTHFYAHDGMRRGG